MAGKKRARPDVESNPTPNNPVKTGKTKPKHTDTAALLAKVKKQKAETTLPKHKKEDIADEGEVDHEDEEEEEENMEEVCDEDFDEGEEEEEEEEEDEEEEGEEEEEEEE